MIYVGLMLEVYVYFNLFVLWKKSDIIFEVVYTYTIYMIILHYLLCRVEAIANTN